MATKAMARGYWALTAIERFRLATAAMARGDEVEIVRLRAAARPVAAEVTDQFGYTVAFVEVAKDHWAARLHAAALLFRMRHLADVSEPHAARMAAAARVAAHLLGVYADGWALFCRGAGLDPGAGDGLVEFEDTVRQAEEEAAAMGVTEAEAVAIAKGDHWHGDAPDEAPLKTCESVAVELQQQYAERLARWGSVRDD